MNQSRDARLLLLTRLLTRRLTLRLTRLLTPHPLSRCRRILICFPFLASYTIGGFVSALPLLLSSMSSTTFHRSLNNKNDCLLNATRFDKMTTALTPQQIDEICERIPVNPNLPERVRLSTAARIRTRLANDLAAIRIYPELFPKLKAEVERYYYQTLAASGEAVGVQVAQSIGERQTQSTLNTFHSSGLSIKTVVVGVPRFSELLNATKSPKMVNCLMYLTESFADVGDLRQRVSNYFTDITVRRLIQSSELIKDEPLEDWHHLFCDLHDIHPGCLGWRLRLNINRESLYEYRVSLKMIADIIMQEYSDATVLYTPDWVGIIDVFVDEGCFVERKPIEPVEEVVEEEEEELIDILEEEEDEEEVSTKKVILPILRSRSENREDIVPPDMDRVVHMEDKVLPALSDIRVCGIAGIKDIFFEKRKEEWIVTTEGSNLSELFRHPLIDKSRTMSNDMWEIYHIFGIEATRQFLIEEYMDIVSSDGTFVNPSNVELLVDIMVYTGTIISISRYGQKKVGCGPMAKASFEESLENFMKAGVNGEKESANGVSASIMLGKMPNIGTGVFDLMVDFEKLVEDVSETKKTLAFSRKPLFF